MTTLRFNGPIAFDTFDGRGVPVAVLDGARFVSIQAAADGNVEFVYLDSGNVEQTFLIELVQTTTGLNLEQVQDAVAALLAEGDNVTLTYDDAAGTLTIAATGGGAGDGTDQTARDAALAAQQAADTAQGAADTAQGEIDTHEASTHNTDSVARNRGATARTEAQEAQTTVDDHIANHPGNGGGNGTPHTEQRVFASRIQWAPLPRWANSRIDPDWQRLWHRARYRTGRTRNRRLYCVQSCRLCGVSSTLNQTPNHFRWASITS